MSIDEQREFPGISVGGLQTSDNCYCCGDKATSIEHVPPRSWFKSNGWSIPETVPACKTHNQENSQEVELVRNLLVISSSSGARSEIAERFERSRSGPKLAAELGESNGQLTPEQFRQLFHCLSAIGNGLAYLIRRAPQDLEWGLNSNLWSYSDPLVAEVNQHTLHHYATSLTFDKWVEHESREPETFAWKHLLLKDDRLVLRLRVHAYDFILEELTDPTEHS